MEEEVSSERRHNQLWNKSIKNENLTIKKVYNIAIHVMEV